MKKHSERLGSIAPREIEADTFFIFSMVAVRYYREAKEFVFFFRFFAANSEVPFYKLETFEVGSKRYRDMLSRLRFAGLLHCNGNDHEALLKEFESLSGFCRLVSAGNTVEVDVTSFMSTKDFVANMDIDALDEDSWLRGR